MKNLILLLAVSFFVLNCYSYKNVNDIQTSNLQSEKIYELQLENKEKVIARNLRIENQYYFYTDSKNREKSIPESSVTEVKERKFSWLKTGGLIVGSSAIIIGATIISLNNMKILGNDFNPQLSQ